MLSNLATLDAMNSSTNKPEVELCLGTFVTRNQPLSLSSSTINNITGVKTMPQLLLGSPCIGFYRENAIAIESEASDPNGGNVCLFSAATCTSQCNLPSCRQAFVHKERNLHCDIHVAAEN